MKCSVCGKVTTEGNASHTGDATACTGKKECTVCGTPYDTANDHGQGKGFYAVSNNNGTHNEYCGDCDALISENVTCSPADGKCTLCGYCKHAGSFRYPNNSNGTHNVICNICNTTTQEGVTCTDSDDDNHLCDYCQIAVPGDVCVDNSNDHKCDECGETTSECVDSDKNHECDYAGCKAVMGDHKSDAAYSCVDGSCKYCKAVMLATENHTYENYTYNNDATCTQDGTKTGTCKCGATDNRTATGTRLNHTYENYTYNNDATCTQDGTETGTCKCGATDIRTATGTKLDHTYKNYTYNNDATCTQDGTETGTCKCGATDIRTATGTKLNHTYENGSCVCGDKLTGWDGTIYYDGGVKVTGWKEVAGAWYYFGQNGYTTGAARVPYRDNTMYPYYYVDMNYAQDHGNEFIDKDLTWYLFGENGVLSSFTGIQDGRYYSNGMAYWHPGFVNVDGVWYYFVGDADNGGNKLADGQIYVTRNTEAADYNTGDQLVFVNGKVETTLHGIVTKDNVLYYYDGGKLMAGKGLVEIEKGKYIYVRTSGKLAVGDYYIPANELGVVSALYTFDENGYMVMPKYTNVNGVVNGFYYKAGKVQYGAGLIKWEGNIYYVRSNGQVATGWYYITKTNDVEGFYKGMKLFFGEDGKLQPVKNGIVEEEGELYYYEDNHIMYGAGLLKLEDENGEYYIYVRSTGKVQTGYVFITNTNELEGFEVGDHCKFGEDGKLISSFDTK